MDIQNMRLSLAAAQVLHMSFMNNFFYFHYEDTELMSVDQH